MGGGVETNSTHSSSSSTSSSPNTSTSTTTPVNTGTNSNLFRYSGGRDIFVNKFQIGWFHNNTITNGILLHGLTLSGKVLEQKYNMFFLNIFDNNSIFYNFNNVSGNRESLKRVNPLMILLLPVSFTEGDVERMANRLKPIARNDDPSSYIIDTSDDKNIYFQVWRYKEDAHHADFLTKVSGTTPSRNTHVRYKAIKDLANNILRGENLQRVDVEIEIFSPVSDSYTIDKINNAWDYRFRSNYNEFANQVASNNNFKNLIRTAISRRDMLNVGML